jgi:hypothetical protein
MFLHCGPVRRCLLDDDDVATDGARNLLHCEFGLYWVFGRNGNDTTSNSRLFARGLWQTLKYCFQRRDQGAHDRICRLAPRRGERIISYRVTAKINQKYPTLKSAIRLKPRARLVAYLSPV